MSALLLLGVLAHLFVVGHSQLCLLTREAAKQKVPGIKLQERLGKGYYGVVYKGIEEATNATVAVKFFNNRRRPKCVLTAGQMPGDMRYTESELPLNLWEKTDEHTKDFFVAVRRPLPKEIWRPAYIVMDLLEKEKYTRISTDFCPQTGALKHMYLAVQALLAYSVLLKPPNAVIHRDWHFGNLQMRITDWRFKTYDFSIATNCPQDCNGRDIRRTGFWVLMASMFGGGLGVARYREAALGGDQATAAALHSTLHHTAASKCLDAAVDPTQLLNRLPAQKGSLMAKAAAKLLKREMEEAEALGRAEQDEWGDIVQDRDEKKKRGGARSVMNTMEGWMFHAIPQPWHLQSFAAFKMAVQELVEQRYDFDYELKVGRDFKAPAGWNPKDHDSGEYVKRQYAKHIKRGRRTVVMPDDEALHFAWWTFKIARMVDEVDPYRVGETPCHYFDVPHEVCFRILAAFGDSPSGRRDKKDRKNPTRDAEDSEEENALSKSKAVHMNDAEKSEDMIDRIIDDMEVVNDAAEQSMNVQMERSFERLMDMAPEDLASMLENMRDGNGKVIDMFPSLPDGTQMMDGSDDAATRQENLKKAFADLQNRMRADKEREAQGLPGVHTSHTSPVTDSISEYLTKTTLPEEEELPAGPTRKLYMTMVRLLSCHPFVRATRGLTARFLHKSDAELLLLDELPADVCTPFLEDLTNDDIRLVGEQAAEFEESEEAEEGEEEGEDDEEDEEGEEGDWESEEEEEEIEENQSTADEAAEAPKEKSSAPPVSSGDAEEVSVITS
uniref:Protein kinase domain-containing protein n=1 Tax=Chromera velia CCMP2878 TaxID=1169474 RepID=A0A0G4GEW9_9ALVE|eukprot:Cvel_21572.t1-p1 / transcript=Cvel_21572.t1 / gene=Cvel_21572 / organism=Chromera_velia_CCMP2878 / gene_product=hypothetical protein / transcript_product=hypothetical protein / location=Cvel_scaffold2035:12439-18212(-) / protein_length=781 / sequence_SO=supercontig / SO=protein_coding / is_pseudo=false